jgi:hypothetical protein
MIKTTRNTNNTSLINDEDIQYIINHDLTSELADVEAQLDNKVSKTGNETIAGVKTFNDDVVIFGDLTVNGTETILNTETINLEDNLIRINYGQTGVPPSILKSGIEVERGDETNYQFLFEESTDLFKIGMVGDLQAVATRDDTMTDQDIPKWDATNSKLTPSGIQAADLTGLTGNVQTQLDNKQNIVSGVSDTEIGYLDGTTSNIQTQLNGKLNDTGDTMNGILTLTNGGTGFRRGV